ncbi:RodZ domain-containing protein [Pelagibius sp. CAU 1746]|uniref:helix-turn-helix domain-containing protein n=1 Tax=Pelagibius sp. CAU 1746 TaxID=3140370 RepID=UPI00325AAD06
MVEPEGAPEIAIAQELQGESVSDTLIRARQQVGQDLRSIAEVLCIRYSYLDAIERGQYENLPGATYAVGFVRTYAEYLGLDGEQVVERFKSEVEGLDNQTKLHFPTPAPEGKMPGGAVFLVAALLFAGAYGVWFYLSNNGESLGDLVAPVPERLQELVDGEAPGATAQSGAAAEATPAPAAAEAETAPPPAAPAAPAPAQSAALPAVEPAPAVADAAEAAAPVEDAPAPVEPESAVQASETAMTPAQDGPSVASAAEGEAPAAAESAESQPAVPQTLPQAAEVSGVAAESAPQAAATPSVPAETPPAETPAAETPAAEAPARSDAYAIPAAPDSNTPATAFLTNHQPQVYGEENADARIVLRATQDAWVQVRDRQGTLLLTRVLRVGDTYRVPNQDDLTLLTGNAGGLEITVDGRALAPLGPVGAVRRNIPLTPDSLLGGASR